MGRTIAAPPLRLRELVARAALGLVSGATVGLGLYPVGAACALAALRRRPLPPGLVRTVAAEWAVNLAFHAARPIGLLAGPPRGAGPRPVILVHGYAMSRTCFALLERRLVAAG